jgi:hypothetical protein
MRLGYFDVQAPAIIVADPGHFYTGLVPTLCFDTAPDQESTDELRKLIYFLPEAEFLLVSYVLYVCGNRSRIDLWSGQ